MLNVVAWMRRMRTGSGAAIQALDKDRAVAILFVGSTAEPRPQSGWDPYEVWQTRLKRPSIATQEREPLPADEAARSTSISSKSAR